MPRPSSSTGSLRSGLALISTTTSFYLLNPANGTLTLIDTYTNLGKALPVPQATFPGQVTQAAMTAAADSLHVWGVADAGTGTQLVYLFDANTGRMTSQVWTTTPPLLPRVTVAADGSWAMIGWAQYTRAQCGGRIHGPLPAPRGDRLAERHRPCRRFAQ